MPDRMGLDRSPKAALLRLYRRIGTIEGLFEPSREGIIVLPAISKPSNEGKDSITSNPILFKHELIHPTAPN